MDQNSSEVESSHVPHVHHGRHRLALSGQELRVKGPLDLRDAHGRALETDLVKSAVKECVLILDG